MAATRRPIPDGLAAPARRALDDAGLADLDRVARYGRRRLGALHGMGPRAIATIETALAEHDLRFSDD